MSVAGCFHGLTEEADNLLIEDTHRLYSHGGGHRTATTTAS